MNIRGSVKTLETGNSLTFFREIIEKLRSKGSKLKFALADGNMEIVLVETGDAVADDNVLVGCFFFLM